MAPAAMRAEFTVEPFVEGNPGRHVQAAIDASRRDGVVVDVGPFGTSIEGDADAVLAAIDATVRAAMDSGASRVTLQVTL